MPHPRKLLFAAGVLLLLIGGWCAWRASHPPLSDEEQITANIESLRAAIESRNTGRITSYLADDFTWNGMNKREINSRLTGGFWKMRDVTANVTGLQISLDGDQATSIGKFSLAFRSDAWRGPNAQIGDFKLFWQKNDGQWVITKAEGGEKIEN